MTRERGLIGEYLILLILLSEFNVSWCKIYEIFEESITEIQKAIDSEKYKGSNETCK